MRHVHDRRRLGARHAVRLDERATQCPEHALARGEPAFAGVHRPERLRAEQQRARDGAPSSERVFDRRLAHDQIGVTRVEQEPTARRGRAVLVLGEPCDELANGALVLEPDVHLSRLRRVPAARAPLVDAQRRAVAGDRVQPAAGDDRLEQAELEQALRGGIRDRRLDRAQRCHERGDVAGRVQGRDGLAQRLSRRIRAEALHELPVRHTAWLEPASALLVFAVDAFDQKGAALARADAAAKCLLRGHRRVALPEECLGDDRSMARRAVRAIELAHRDAVGRADQRAVGHALERGEHRLGGRREGDDGAGPFTDRLARFRYAAPVR